MNTMKMLALAALCSAVVEPSVAGQETVEIPSEQPGTAMSDEVTDKTLTDNATKTGEAQSNAPAGRNWQNLGIEKGQTILAAEQGIVIATQRLAQTKTDVLLEMCNLDESGRAQFIGGVDNAFRTKDGDKLSKTHQNFMADARRVSANIKNGMELGKAIETLKGVGTYAERMEKFAKVSPRGGSNKGTGTANVVADAIAAVGADAVNAAVTALSTAPERHSQQPAFGTSELIAAVETAHENQLDALALKLADRLTKSASQAHRDIGIAMKKVLDSQLIADAHDQAMQLPVAVAA